MMDLKTELTTPSKRVTVPHNSVAVILSKPVADEIRNMCLLIRRSRRLSGQDKNQIQSICGDLLLAIVEAE